MGVPVTGPFTRDFTQNGPPRGVGGDFRPHWVVGRRVWYRQTKPFDRELSFEYKCTSITKAFGGSDVDYVDAYMHPGLRVPLDFRNRVYAKAYENFMGKVKKETAELGSLLATMEKSRDMITDRATKLWKGFQAVRKGDVRTVKALWGKKAGIIKRKNVRTQSGNVLEIGFGWAPLVADIVGAVKVLGEGYPEPRIRSGLNAHYSYHGGWVDFGAVKYLEIAHGKTECRLRGSIKITNPNAFLLNELGLANPATVLWEVTPWSFVFDYFVNVQAFLQSFTDRLGLELRRESHTFFTIENGSYTGVWDQLPYPTYNPISHEWERVECTRSPGIPGPNLVWRLPWRMSVRRASTSIALLLQQLTKK